MGERGAWKMKQLFHTAQVFGLPKVHTLDYGECTAWIKRNSGARPQC